MDQNSTQTTNLLNIFIFFSRPYVFLDNKHIQENHRLFLSLTILFSLAHFSLNLFTKELNDILFLLKHCKSNNNRVEKIAIWWIFNALTQWPMNCPMVPIRVTILGLFNNITNKFIDLMLKKSFIVINRYHKFFKGDTMLDQSEPSLFNGKNKWSNI